MNYEKFFNLEDLIKSSHKNTEALLEMYFRLVSNSDASMSENEILSQLRDNQNNLIDMEQKVAECITNLK